MRPTISPDDTYIPAFRRMVQKIRPDFDETRQYCLWLVPDYWDAQGLGSAEVDGTVILHDADGQTIPISDYLDTQAKFVIRTPYINKSIFQVGLARGPYRVFGIPLVTDSLDELLRIRTVCVPWRIHLNGENLSLTVVHHVTLSGQGSGHWFTLARQDTWPDPSMDTVARMTGYHDSVRLCYRSGFASPPVVTCSKRLVLPATHAPAIIAEPGFGFTRP